MTRLPCNEALCHVYVILLHRSPKCAPIISKPCSLVHLTEKRYRADTPRNNSSSPPHEAYLFLPSNMAVEAPAESDAEFWLFGYG